MIFFSNRQWIVGFLVFFSVVSAISSRDLDYANYLYSQEDYYRTISECKEIQFYNNEQLSLDAGILMAKSYYLSNLYDYSINTCEKELDRTSNNVKRVLLLQLIANNYIEKSNYPIAYNYVEKANTYDSFDKYFLYESLLCAINDDPEKAYDILIKKGDKADHNVNINEIIESTEQYINQPKKSSVVAGVLSGIIPGSGQFYNQHYTDGLQALFMVSTTLLSSFGMYHYDKANNSNYLLTGITAFTSVTLYVSNIYGAIKTSQYYNHKRRQNYIDSYKRAIQSSYQW